MFKFYKKYITAKIVIILGAIIFSSVAFAMSASENEKEKPDNYYLKQFQNVFNKIEKEYIQKPNRQEMTDEAINGMLKSLDPYSEYYTGDDLDFFNTHTEGEFGGIGVEIIYEHGAIKVITPIDDMPAYNAGIRAGDYIVGIEGKLVSNMGFNKSVKEMRGKAGTGLNLLIVKEGENITKEVELKREIIKITPIKYEIQDDESGVVAYLRIVAFNQKTTSDLKKAVIDITAKLQKQNKKIQGIILDLRNNPGGLLNEAVSAGEYFIDQGTIVSVKGKDSENATIMSAGRFVAKAPKVPLVVLINAGTASAAEILAGAIQDHKRGVVIGTTSFGKGLVQTFSHITDRAAVKLTTAKYYTPSGKSINAKGIVPDIYIENAKVEYAKKEENKKSFTNETVKSYLKKYNKDEILVDKKNKEDKKSDLSEKYKNDYQYARAYDLIRGLIISQERIK